MTIYGYRYSVTGAFGYEFYEQGRRVCAVSELVVPDAQVHMSGWGLSWLSDGGRRNVPVRPLSIRDHATGRKTAEVVADGCGEYILSCGGEEIVAAEEGDALVYTRGGAVVARRRRAGADEAPRIELYGETTAARFVVEIAETLGDGMRLLLIGSVMLCG